MKKTLEYLVNVVCAYLRVNEDLFFCSPINSRINDARKYVAYFAYMEFKMPPSVVSSYMGVSERRASITIDRAKAIQSALFYDQASQTALDINAIKEIVDKPTQK